MKELKKLFRLHSINSNNFEYFLRNYLHIPKQYKIRAEVIFGYDKDFHNLEKARYRIFFVKRVIIENYILKSKYAE